MAGHDLGVAPGIAERQPRLLDGAQAEDREGGDHRESSPPPPCRPPPPSCSARRCRTGSGARDGFCGNDARRCRRRCRRPAPPAWEIRRPAPTGFCRRLRAGNRCWRSERGTRHREDPSFRRRSAPSAVSASSVWARRQLHAAMPGGNIFHIGHALALDGVGDDHRRLLARGAGAAQMLQDLRNVMAVDLGHRPAEGAAISPPAAPAA